MTNDRWISKSKYLSGLQCAKLLWTQYNAKDQIPEPDAATQAVFDQGHAVGLLAQSLFPGGKAVEWNDDFSAALRATRDLLPLRQPIYEATLAAGGVFARADILCPVEDGLWDLIEVKSSTGVKGAYLNDVAIQRYCYEAAGVPIRRCYLMHINNQYVRRGEVDAGGLLAATDITDAVAPLLPSLGDRVAEMQQVINLNTCPVVEVGPHCDQPYSCPLKEICWAERWKAEEESRPTGDLESDPQAIRQFMDGLVWPVHFLDFETIGTAIPLFDECRPYQQVPFQFSLHVVDRLDAEPRHVSWLWDGIGDPRTTLFSELRKAICSTGSVLAYNKRFEEACLMNAADAITEHACWVRDLMPRMVDLADPIRSHAVRHPTLGRKWSLKLVLPLLTGQGYDDLAIGDGLTASAEFLRVMFTPDGIADRDRVRSDLEAYCGLDTSGMVAILRQLDVLASGMS